MSRVHSSCRAWGAVGVMMLAVPPPGKLSRARPQSGWCTILEEEFERGSLDANVWKTTAANDFRHKLRDIVDRGGDHELRLAADTVGTDDATVKRLGIVHPELLDLDAEHEIRFELD